MDTNFFGKENYSEEDIESLISNEIEESITLEFKGGKAIENNKEIAKDISAFANSNGGIIIYGLDEINHKANNLSFIDGNRYTKEALDQIITTRIVRRIPNLKIFPIRFQGDLNNTVYLVRIPESQLAPHMVDGRFYKRHNFTTLRMEEYEVRNAYFKNQTPILKIELSAMTSIGYYLNEPIYYTNFLISNIGNVLERFFKLEIFLSKEIYASYKGDSLSNSLSRENPLNKYKRHESKKKLIFVISNSEPIFPNETMKLAETYLKLDKKRGSDITKAIEDEVLHLKMYYSGGILEEKYSIFQLLVNGELVRERLNEDEEKTNGA